MSILSLQEGQQDPNLDRLVIRMKQVEEELVLRTPRLHDALADIHKNLAIHEELVHLMDDDDIAVLHKAHEIHKQYALIQKEEKKVSGKGRKKLSNDELNNL